MLNREEIEILGFVKESGRNSIYRFQRKDDFIRIEAFVGWYYSLTLWHEEKGKEERLITIHFGHILDKQNLKDLLTVHGIQLRK
jgi:hypothetical protein